MDHAFMERDGRKDHCHALLMRRAPTRSSMRATSLASRRFCARSPRSRLCAFSRGPKERTRAEGDASEKRLSVGRGDTQAIRIQAIETQIPCGSSKRAQRSADSERNVEAD
jgi:hypothetical protein